MIIHRIGAKGMDDDGTTECGITVPLLLTDGVYQTYGLSKLYAKLNSWEGVTCKRCLRHATAPGNIAHEPNRTTTR